MGIWGPKPFENDNAWDWMDLINGPIIQTIYSTLNAIQIGKRTKPQRSGYLEAIAAAALLTKFSHRLSIPNLFDEAWRRGLFTFAAQVLKQIDADGVWIGSCKDTMRIHGEIQRQITKLNQLHEDSGHLRMKVATIGLLRKGSKGRGERNRRLRSPQETKSRK